MDTKKHEIENIIEQVVESIVFDAFDDNFTEEEDIEYALKVLKNKKPKQYSLSNKYFKFLKKRTKLDNKSRYKLIFK